jgi:hypothetical protein
VSGDNIEAVIRKARGNDLLRLREIERAADERFRERGRGVVDKATGTSGDDAHELPGGAVELSLL